MARRTGATRALVAAAAAGVEVQVHTYVHDDRAGSWGLEAAEALGFDPARVFKTLMVSADGTLAVAVVPVDRSLDLKSAAAALGAKKVQMADVAAAERATGYVVGGISPLGQRTRHSTVVDRSALDHDTVLVSAGKRGMDLELDPRDLVVLTDAVTAPISR